MVGTPCAVCQTAHEWDSICSASFQLYHAWKEFYVQWYKPCMGGIYCVVHHSCCTTHGWYFMCDASFLLYCTWMHFHMQCIILVVSLMDGILCVVHYSGCTTHGWKFHLQWYKLCMDGIPYAVHHFSCTNWESMCSGINCAWKHFHVWCYSSCTTYGWDLICSNINHAWKYFHEQYIILVVSCMDGIPCAVLFWLYRA